MTQKEPNEFSFVYVEYSYFSNEFFSGFGLS